MISCRPWRIARTISPGDFGGVTGGASGQPGPPLSSSTLSKNSVSVVPGLTTSTSIPCAAHSVRIDSLKPRTRTCWPHIRCCRGRRDGQDRAYVDHDRPVSLLQERQGQPGHLHQGEEIDFHDATDPGGIGLVEQPHGPTPALFTRMSSPPKLSATPRRPGGGRPGR